MKLRISSSDLAVLKKDITRFAPAWVLYSVFLLMFLVGITVTGAADSNMVYSGSAMAVVNILYALLVAQLLFGDLFNTRMVNSLHAMPVRRESWFVVHVIAGLLFSFVPNLVFALVVMPQLRDIAALAICGSWLLQVTLQYIFFYGLAIFCMLCVGSRFAAVVVYSLVNSASLIAYWLIDTLYISQLYGVILDVEPFLELCPVWQMIVRPVSDMSYTQDGTVISANWENWQYTLVAAVIGIALGAAALLLYRRRQLETAGDFIAVKQVKPVFLVAYTMTMVAFFHFFYEEILGRTDWSFIYLGLAVGWLTGNMFLMRTTRVVKPKVLISMAVFAAVLTGSFGLTILDPLGFTRWVPETEDVESVHVTIGSRVDVVLDQEDAELLEELLEAHQVLVDEPHRGTPDNGYIMDRYAFDLEYEMSDGTTVRRSYQPLGSWVVQQLGDFLNDPKVVLGDAYDYIDQPQRLEIENGSFSLDAAQRQGLLDAILADCAEGNMCQIRIDNAYDYVETLWITHPIGQARHSDMIYIYSDAEHTVAWLEEHKPETE